MRKKISLFAMLVIVSVLIMSGCGTSEEKLSEVTAAREELLKASQEARETYLDITDASESAKLEELEQQVTEISALDLKRLGDTKVDEEVLPRIAELSEDYSSLQADLSGVYKTETSEKQELEKHSRLDTYFINKTGKNLVSIKFHDITQDTLSDNFLGEDVVLKAGYTLMGTALDIYADSSEWEFIVTDDGGTEYNISCEGLSGKDLEGASIVLKYNSESGKGSAELGGYSAEEPVTEEGSDTKDEGSASEDTKKEADESSSSEASSAEGN